MTLTEQRNILQAAIDGEQIQWRRKLDHATSNPDNLWSSPLDLTPPSQPQLNFQEYDYRVQPAPREFWAISHTSCTCGTCIDDKYGWHLYAVKPTTAYGPIIRLREVID